MQKSITNQKAKHSNARITLSYSEIEPVILPSSVQFSLLPALDPMGPYQWVIG